MTFVPTQDELARMFPRALPEWLDALDRLAPDLCRHYEITRLRWVHRAGQIAAETDGLSLRSMTENMRFTSAERIVEVYSMRLGRALKIDATLRARHGSKTALARYLVGKPTELADIVYGDREGTPWMQGSRYLGRGPTQITHRNNYAAIMAEIRKQPGGKSCPDLVADPERLADDPDLGIRSAFADFAIKGLDRWSDCDDCDTLSDALNTGNVRDQVKPHGLPRRRRETARAKAIWPHDRDDKPPRSGKPSPEPQREPLAAISLLSEGSEGPDVAAIQGALRRLGYQLGSDDGKWGTLTTRAVVAFQHEHGMDATGAVDWSEGSGFRQAIESTAPADLGPRATITAKDLRERGSTAATMFGRIRATARAVWTSLFGGAVAETQGVPVVDTVTAGVDHVAGLASKLGGVNIASGPTGKIVLVAVAVGVALMLLDRWASKGEADRVEKARTGADVSK